MTPDPLRPSLN